MKAVVIFDFDGTLSDSLDLFIQAINNLADRFNYKKINSEDVKMLQGKSTRQHLKYLNISLLKAPFVLKSLRKEMNDGIAHTGIAATADIRDVLENLKKNDCIIGILTSNSKKNVKEFLTRNNLDVFDFVYSESSIFGKERILGRIIRKNKFEKSKTFYIGDEIRDIEAAKKAKIKMIAASWGYNTIESLEQENPDHIVNTPQDIEDIILGKNIINNGNTNHSMNKVVHFEIPYDDQGRAQKFYQDVFGWQITKFPEMDYYLANTTESDENMKPKEPGAINGGLLPKDPTGSSPVLVIDVPSIDEHIKKIKSAGGKTVMPKMQVSDFGLYARVADTEGNIIGIWQTLKNC